MLARSHRLTRAREFDTAVRRGRRAGASTLVIHLAEGEALGSPRVGFVVGRGVGKAVERNRVKRRLRHLVRDRLDRLPSDSFVVIRALPSAARVPWSSLAADLDRSLDRLTTRATR